MKLGNIFKKVELNEQYSENNAVSESILDPEQRQYATWLIDEKGHFNKAIKKQIYSILRKWRDQINFKFDIEKIEAKGSLLTKRYNETSDLDITVYVSMTKEQIDSVVELLPQGNKIIVDGKETQHPIDFWLSEKDDEINHDNVDALFDVGNDKWIKEPVEYKNDIPLDYLLGVCNFFINGCTIAITNYQNDKTIYEFYKGIDTETQSISDDEKKKAIADKKMDLKEDLDALRMANHFMSSFRREVYSDDPTAFSISIETTSDNKHVTLNEQVEKIMEKLGMRQQIKSKIEECENLLKDDIPHEEEKAAAENETPSEN